MPAAETDLDISGLFCVMVLSPQHLGVSGLTGSVGLGGQRLRRTQFVTIQRQMRNAPVCPIVYS